MVAASMLKPSSSLLTHIQDSCSKVCQEFTDGFQRACRDLAGRVVEKAGLDLEEEPEALDQFPGRTMTANPMHLFAIFSLPDVRKSFAFRQGFIKEAMLDVMIAEIMSYSCVMADRLQAHARRRDLAGHAVVARVFKLVRVVDYLL